MHKNLIFGLVLGGIGFVATNASAVVTFSDNFETATATPDTFAQQNALAPGARTDADPANTVYGSSTAVAGQWFQVNKSGTPVHDIQVTTNGAPGAAEGNQYLRLHRSGGADCVIAAAFSNWDAPITSGTVSATWKQYVPGGQGPGFIGGVFGCQFLDNNSSALTAGSKATLFFRNSGVLRQSFNFFGNNPDLASPVATLDKWQTWTLVQDFDAKQYTITIDGITSASAGFNFPNGGGVGIAFNAQEGAEYYVDDVVINYTPVPEPAVASLLLAPACMFLRRRRA